MSNDNNLGLHAAGFWRGCFGVYVSVRGRQHLNTDPAHLSVRLTDRQWMGLGGWIGSLGTAERDDGNRIMAFNMRVRPCDLDFTEPYATTSSARNGRLRVGAVWVGVVCTMTNGARARGGRNICWNILTWDAHCSESHSHKQTTLYVCISSYICGV